MKPDRRTRTTGGDVAIILGAVSVALLGFTTSFQAVSTALESDFKALAPLVPLGVDLGILVSSIAYIALTRRGEGHPLLRIVPHALTGATVYLNVTTGETIEGSIAHGVMVSLWAVAVEVAAHVARRRMGLDTGTRIDPVPVRRWLLDPVRTLLLWRRMVLWNITEYRRAVEYEKARRYAIGVCKARYGRYRWRRAISPLLRYEVVTGDLPDQVTIAVDQVVDKGVAAGWKGTVHAWVESHHTGGVADRVEIPVAPDPGPRGTAAGKSPGTSPARRPVRTDEELLPEAHRINAAYRAENGRDISGDRLAAELGVGKTRALALLRHIKTHPLRAV